jgi:hypothetical protein
MSISNDELIGVTYVHGNRVQNHMGLSSLDEPSSRPDDIHNSVVIGGVGDAMNAR